MITGGLSHLSHLPLQSDCTNKIVPSLFIRFVYDNINMLCKSQENPYILLIKSYAYIDEYSKKPLKNNELIISKIPVYIVFVNLGMVMR